jgi:hypothetical protein
MSRSTADGFVENASKSGSNSGVGTAANSRDRRIRPGGGKRWRETTDDDHQSRDEPAAVTHVTATATALRHYITGCRMSVE